jgi:hypothetical protein
LFIRLADASLVFSVLNLLSFLFLDFSSLNCDLFKPEVVLAFEFVGFAASVKHPSHEDYR